MLCRTSDEMHLGPRMGADGVPSAPTRTQLRLLKMTSISGIGLAGVPWTAANNRRVVEQVMENFGPDRIMFASNFPVDGLTGTYADIYGGYLEITKDWSESEQRAAFIGNAVRHYSWIRTLMGRCLSVLEQPKREHRTLPGEGHSRGRSCGTSARSRRRLRSAIEAPWSTASMNKVTPSQTAARTNTSVMAHSASIRQF